jgi:uncharacterized protein with NRDE domain
VCTLVLAWQVFEEAPVTVATNRDEATARPSEPPAVRDWAARVVAPVDGEAGGTWVGYNEHGLFVGITNRWVESDPGERSRGLLVRDALGAESARAARSLVGRELGSRRYEPFHLVLADATDAWLLTWDGVDGTESGVESFSPGVHTVVNVGADGSYFVPERRPDVGRQQATDTDRVRAELEPRDGETAAGWTTRAGEVLGDHGFGRCIHGDGFGTRSASIVRLGTDGWFEHADGPPCTTPFEPVEAPF